MKYCVCVLLLVWFSIGVNAQDENQTIAPELVGKWCYINAASSNDQITNSCITLNSDGTYEAALDRSTLPNGTTLPALQDNDSGRWWFKNNQLFYNSPNHGQGSFSLQKINHPRLENTPTIVLNGIAFAAATPRDPW